MFSEYLDQDSNKVDDYRGRPSSSLSLGGLPCFPLEAGSDLRFTIEAMSGRQGIRTLTTFRPRGLADRPGKPYPATFRNSVDSPGIEPGLLPCHSSVVPLDHEPRLREVRPGIEPGLPPYHSGVLPGHLQTID